MKLQAFGLLAAAVLLSGCELEEVQLAQSEDVIVAEVILRAGAPTQVAWLHRTRGTLGKDPLVENATVRINTPGGSVQLTPANDETCIIQRNDTEPETHGSCYSTTALNVVTGATYGLVITLPDGREMSGVTTVPASFRMLRPAATTCSVPALTPFEVSWTQSTNAWVYASETSMSGVSVALQAQNIQVTREPLRLFGFSVSSADTTITFPGEFGVFDRFDSDLTEALAFLQRGLPLGVVAEVVIAAADRNYVNWERASNFNPSGIVRVPSVHGDGTGVFGSMLPRTFQVRVSDIRFPAC